MKTLITALFALFIITSSTKTYSQSSTTMQDILETVTTKVVELEDEKNQEAVNITLDLIVNQGKKMVYRNLDPSFDYTAVLFGDRRVSKLKLSVHKKAGENWDYVSELSSASPSIKINPAEYEQYEFTVSIDSFKGDNTAGHFALLLYHRNPVKK